MISFDRKEELRRIRTFPGQLFAGLADLQPLLQAFRFFALKCQRVRRVEMPLKRSDHTPRRVLIRRDRL